MKKYSKKHTQSQSVIPTGEISKAEAIKLCKEIATAKFDESIDVAFSLGIDPKKCRRKYSNNSISSKRYW
jgi:large subunit ribosomal protein L1